MQVRTPKVVIQTTRADPGVISGSFLRPFGGCLADRMGGVRTLTVIYLAVGVLALGLTSSAPFAGGAILLFAVMALFEMGNGTVFQLVPNRFPREIGVTTGIIGAAGGLGGFALPNVLGTVKELTGEL